MAQKSLNEASWLINHNQIHESLLKAEALLEIALSSDLQSVSVYTFHDYLWALNDLVSRARKLM
tara:strand:- start:440 stop:631 length:192 start_codon:yes stop_codon:yes gene_type:complete